VGEIIDQTCKLLCHGSLTTTPNILLLIEMFEDTIGVIRSNKSKRTDNTMAKGKKDKRANKDLKN